MVATADLRQARDAGPNVVPLRIARHRSHEAVHKHRPLGSRANEAHFATHNVPELRNLVNAEHAQIATYARQTRVVIASRQYRSRLRLGSMYHCSKLEYIELLAVSPNALLGKDHRSLGS